MFELYSVPSFDSHQPEQVAGKEIGSSKQLVGEHDVLLCKINPRINRVWTVGNHSSWVKIASTEWISFPRVSGVCPEFLCYYMQTNEFRTFLSMRASGVGGSLMRINSGTLAPYPFPLAPMREQERIADCLATLSTRLDACVEALQQLQVKLARYRAAVLKAAVEGNLTGEWRATHKDLEPSFLLLQRILHARREAWEQAELARYAIGGSTQPRQWRVRYREARAPGPRVPFALPAGWCWATIDQLLSEPLANGISVKGTDLPPGVPALRLSAMSDTGFNYAERRYIPVDNATVGALAIRTGDFFVSRGNGSRQLVGRGTLAQPPREDIVFPDTMIRVRLAPVAALVSFVSTIWPARVIRAQVEGTARTTAGIYKISQADIERFVIPLPPVEEQIQIVSEVGWRLSVVATAEAEIEEVLKRAERLRHSILRQAFAGKLVPQDSSDEPASLLLDRIRAQRDGPNQRPSTTKPVQLQLV